VPSREEPAGRGGVAALARSLPVRLAVTAVLLGILATEIDWDAAWKRVSEGNPLWLVLGVALLDVGLVAGAARWHLLLADTPWRETLRVYFMGAFANNFLPTGFGGDAVRSVAAAQGGTGLAMAAATVIGGFLTPVIEPLAMYGLPLAAGVTIYVAASNLIPESQHERSSVVQAAVFAGVVAYYLMRVFLPDGH
jgi:uncharacterized membrane protein YbhN (UPF0104 family)